MGNCSAWSATSRACRIELRRSRLLAGALLGLGCAGVFGWFLSDAGGPVSLAGSAFGLAYATRLARRELRRGPLGLVLGADGRAYMDGHELSGFEVSWRGGLVSLSWRTGARTERRLAFPDALTAAHRRELRLWALRRREHAEPAAVAP